MGKIGYFRDIVRSFFGGSYRKVHLMALGSSGSGKRPSRKVRNKERGMIARAIEEGIEHFENLGKGDLQMSKEEIDKAMPNFQDKLPLIDAYIRDLLQLNCMRSQIPGNVISEANRLAIGLFRRWTKGEQMDLIAGMVHDIDDIFMGAFRQRMLDDAHKSAPREKGTGGDSVEEPESKAGTPD